jgi:hypothetical protein
MTGSVLLPEYEAAAVPEYTGDVAWIVPSPRGPVSQYPPGAALLAAPAYWLAHQPLTLFYVDDADDPNDTPIPFPLDSPAPGAIVAALATAVAMGLVAQTVFSIGGSQLQAVATGYVGGLATPMWATASDALWQHGPAAMWVALALYLVSRDKLMLSGLAFGMVVLTRPPLIVIAICVGLYVGWNRRSLSSTARIAFGTLAGLAALLAFNWWVWGTLTVSGGYGADFVNRTFSLNVVGYAENLFRALFDLNRGLFLYAPFLLLLIPGLRAAWRSGPDWARAAAVGGVLYLLLVYKANRFSGGDGFIGYRYPLEALTAAAVLLFASYRGWVSRRPLIVRAFWVAVAIGVVPQIYWKAL